MSFGDIGDCAIVGRNGSTCLCVAKLEFSESSKLISYILESVSTLVVAVAIVVGKLLRCGTGGNSDDCDGLTLVLPLAHFPSTGN